MAGEYTITLSDGVTTFTVYPNEVNGTGFSTPHHIVGVNLTGGAGTNYFELAGDLRSRFIGGFQFVVELSAGSLPEITNIDFTTHTIVAGDYWTINSPTTSFYVWYKVDGVGVDPTPGGTGIRVDILSTDTPVQISTKTKDVLDVYSEFIVTTVSSNVIAITNVVKGAVSDATSATSGVTVTVIQQGTNGLNDGTYTVVASGSIYNNGVTIIPVTTAISNSGLPFGVIKYQIPSAEIATSLELPGKGSIDFGSALLTNVVHHLENFAHTSAPSNPLEGQIWYDTNINELKIWNGAAWNAAGSTLFVLKAGDTMTGVLDMSNNKITSLGDATVATDALNMQTADTRYVNASGDTMSGTLDMGITNKIINLADATNAQDALNMQTADARYVNISGDTMTGFLTLNADPTNALHAATKQYVDNGVSPDYEYFSSGAGQTVFNLTTITYTPGSYRLMVFVNGVKQVYPPNGNYTETSSTSITFSPGLALNTQVEVYHMK